MRTARCVSHQPARGRFTSPGPSIREESADLSPILAARDVTAFPPQARDEPSVHWNDSSHASMVSGSVAT